MSPRLPGPKTAAGIERCRAAVKRAQSEQAGAQAETMLTAIERCLRRRPEATTREVFDEYDRVKMPWPYKHALTDRQRYNLMREWEEAGIIERKIVSRGRGGGCSVIRWRRPR